MGIARWDENDNQGWKRLGVPTVIRHKYKDGPELDMGAVINTVLQDGGILLIYYYYCLLLMITFKKRSNFCFNVINASRNVVLARFSYYYQ